MTLSSCFEHVIHIRMKNRKLIKSIHLSAVIPDQCYRKKKTIRILLFIILFREKSSSQNHSVSLALFCKLAVYVQTRYSLVTSFLETYSVWRADSLMYVSILCMRWYIYIVASCLSVGLAGGQRVRLLLYYRFSHQHEQPSSRLQLPQHCLLSPSLCIGSHYTRHPKIARPFNMPNIPALNKQDAIFLNFLNIVKFKLTMLPYEYSFSISGPVALRQWS